MMMFRSSRRRRGNRGWIQEKEVAKVFKEGGKKGVEIEGAADMSGLTCFAHIQKQGEVALLGVAMEGMNAIPDPSDKGKKRVLWTHF